MINNGNPEDWHSGCVTDSARNEFIIPKTIEVCRNFSAKSVGFLGCATGYIPLKVLSSYSPQNVTLIDTDEDRLNYAKSFSFGKEVEFKNARIENIEHPMNLDLMIIANTLLEFEPDRIFLGALTKHLTNVSNVVVFLPDVLEDVVQEYVAGNRLALHEFINGIREVEKIDKFTLVKTNFYAHRLINLAKQFLDAGFSLRNVDISTTKPRYFMMIFGKGKV